MSAIATMSKTSRSYLLAPTSPPWSSVFWEALPSVGRHPPYRVLYCTIAIASGAVIWVSAAPSGSVEHVLRQRQVVEARILGAEPRQRRCEAREQARRGAVRRHGLQCGGKVHSAFVQSARDCLCNRVRFSRRSMYASFEHAGPTQSPRSDAAAAQKRALLPFWRFRLDGRVLGRGSAPIVIKGRRDRPSA